MLSGILVGMFIAVASLFCLLFLRNITTIFHELGHAIPSLLYTDEPVEMYIGTYGNKERSLKVKTGRLTSYIRFNLNDWNKGMVRHGEMDGFKRQLITLLGGPIASTLIAVPLLIYIIRTPLDDVWVVSISVFILAALIDLIVNLIPKFGTIHSNDGGIFLNDGMQLMLLIKNKTLGAEIDELHSLLGKNDFQKARELSKPLITGKNSRYAFEVYVESLIELKEYKAGIEAFDEYKNTFKYNMENFDDLGVLHLKMHQYKEAIYYLNMVFAENYNDPRLLFHLGQAKLGFGEDHGAIKDFTGALSRRPNYYDAFINRAIACMKIDAFEQAESDLKEAKKIKDSVEIDYYLGELFDKQNIHQKAFDHYDIAWKAGYDQHSLEYKHEMLRLHLEKE